MTGRKILNDGCLPLILTKFKVPLDPKRLMLRPRLLDKLIQHVHHHVMLIQAPAGFGKTGLAIQWRESLMSQGCCVGWLSLDQEDNDPSRYINCLVAAIHNVEAGITVNTAVLSNHASCRNDKLVLAKLVNQLENLSKKVYLVIDDWHFIDNLVVYEAMNFLIEHIPKNFHLIICSRIQPSLPIHTLRIKKQLCVIDDTDLLFDENETSCLLNSFYQFDLDPKDVHDVWLKTEGWVAALQLIILMLPSQKSADDILNRLKYLEKTHAVDQYLTENALGCLPVEMMDFLLKTSILTQLNNDLCNAVSGREDSQSVLEQLCRQGLFIRSFNQEQNWFQYHRLFADFLYSKLKCRMPEQLKSLHMKAAHWLINHQQTEEAVRHAILVQEIHQAILWVEKDAMWLVEHGFMDVLLRLINKLPTKTIHTSITLQLAVAWAHCLTHHQSQAQFALDAIEQILQQQSFESEHNIRLEMHVLQACIDMYADRLDDVLVLLSTNFDEQNIQNPWVRLMANNIITYVFIHTYRYKEALLLQQTMGCSYHQTRGSFVGIYGDCLSGIAYLEQCQLNEAEWCFKKAQQTAYEDMGKNSYVAFLSGALLGRLYYERNQLTKAKILLEKSRLLGAEGGVVDFYVASYCFGGRIALAEGRFDEALVIFKEGIQIAQTLQMPQLDFYLKAELIRFYVLADDIQMAKHIMQQWDAVTAPKQLLSLADLRRCAKARLLGEIGKETNAIRLLSKVLRNDINCGRCYHEIHTRILLASMMNKVQRYDEAEEVLLPALFQGFKQGVVRSFIHEDINLKKVIIRLIKRCHRERQKPTDAAFNRWLVQLLSIVTPNGISKSNTQTIGDSFKHKEMLILNMLEKGLTNKTIAKNLNISIDTVKWYLKSIYMKLGVSQRAKAVIEAKKLNLLD